MITICGECRSIIGSYIYDEISCLEVDERLCLLDNCSEVLDHRGVEPGTIPIVISIKLFHVVVMSELEEPTVSFSHTLHEFKWANLDFLSWERKYSSKCLISEMEN